MGIDIDIIIGVEINPIIIISKKYNLNGRRSLYSRSNRDTWQA